MKFLTFIKENSAKLQNPLSYLIKIILILSILHAVYTHLWPVLVANTFLLFLLFLPLLLRKKYEIYIPKEFELIILIFVVVSFFLGNIRGFIIQIFFGLAIGFVGFTIMLLLYHNSRIKTNYFLIILFAFSFSLALGLGVEMAKFYLKLYLNVPMGVGEHTYTMRSLTLVACGSLIASLLGYLYMKEYKIEFIKTIVQKFKKTNPNLFVKKIDSPEEILELIKKGETDKLEFKETLRTNIHTNQFDRKIEHSALKTITAFLNSEGGTLLIGITDTGEIKGIEKDNFQTKDKFNLHFTNLIKNSFSKETLSFLDFELVLIEEKSILKIDCLKSSKPVFLKFQGEEEFFIRAGPSSTKLQGSELVRYIETKFKKP